ncbi:MAG TPA: isovaleryl-CoA dehydrogenase [Casimicrobiaceae bacterium]|nr:isovaleryl-CoA dehydrogenase [Casimicrobiaceae bacterium]
MPTHEVFNQTPPLTDYNAYERDAALREAVAREGAADAASWLSARGTEIGSASMQALADAANRNPPLLRLFDAAGHRRDAVEFHPAYHELMAYLAQHGAAVGPWAAPAPGAHVSRAALYYLYAQVEDGTLCPTTMTYASVPALRADPALASRWLPLILRRDYDARFLPAAQKLGVTLGMGMTEKQGGSDVRANTTRAEAEGGRAYRIVGHKWFFSAPMCDAFLVLAQAPGGLTCFFMPRFTPDGAVNAIRIQRLKDKLGDRSNASSEVEFEGAYAELVGEEGRGIATILEMGTYCRLDCVLGTAGLMRGAVAQALHHARHRRAFGRALLEAPLMRNVLADLALEAEAAVALALRLARAFDESTDGAEPLRRLLTPAAKFWVCKRGPALAAEAMEVLGGNGYVEEGPLARVYRQMPLNSIWEGAGNIMGLDVLRALHREPRCIDALRAELAPAHGGHAALDRFVEALLADLRGEAADEGSARVIAARIALAVQGALLVRFAPSCVSDAFCASRLAGDFGGAFGLLPRGAPSADIVQRAWPA